MSGPLASLKQLDCEKWSKPDPSELPPIRFVPCPTTKRQVLTKIIYKDDRKDSTYDIQLYDGLGPLEELFLWWQSIESYFARAEITDPTEMFALIPHCLDESTDVQNVWARCRDEAVGTGVLEDDGTTWTELGETELGFDQAQLRFFKHFLPDPLGDNQRRYMQYRLRKPYNLEPKDLIGRLETLNKYLAMFPEEDEQAETRDNEKIFQGSSMLREKDLVTIVLHAIPKRQLHKMNENNMKPFSCSLQYLRDYLPYLQEKSDETYAKPKKGDDKPTDKKTSGTSKPKKGNGGGGKPTNKKFCGFCKALANGKETTHNASDCYLKKRFLDGQNDQSKKKRDNGGQNGRYSKKGELSAIMRDTIVAYEKAKKKKRRRTIVESDSSDDDE